MERGVSYWTPEKQQRERKIHEISITIITILHGSKTCIIILHGVNVQTPAITLSKFQKVNVSPKYQKHKGD